MFGLPIVTIVLLALDLLAAIFLVGFAINEEYNPFLSSDLLLRYEHTRKILKRTIVLLLLVLLFSIATIISVLIFL